MQSNNSILKTIIMKRTSLAIIFACCMLALTAQDAIRVKSRGANPTISDFAWAYFDYINEDECGDKPCNAVKDAIMRYLGGQPQEEGVTLIVDERNGYIGYEYRRDENSVHRMEMCYWNEADGKHKLFAFNNMAYVSAGKPVLTETSGLDFFRYNKATKKMSFCSAPGFEVYEMQPATFALPRIGKDITVTQWHDNGTTTDKTLKWDGHKFSF